MPEQVSLVLSTFAKENFVGGQAAYTLCDGSYSIDAGENDIRAIYDKEASTVKFICRSKREMAFYDKKLLFFAAKYNIPLILSF
ncbi:hypothetical protein Q3O60_14925 [Alkalimonas collagenimarina]|uniref:Uncharacterized protein n=1 Tax=Alkalimonas collagenimarina TaxID=400390 RepID=A0ABT9H2E7_9GAMM|nr:hypothetical protein [Alkalimonas collagenimarina]MDP4537484.1 hypothetical protein [Alkalimonas collagenimarina]